MSGICGWMDFQQDIFSFEKDLQKMSETLRRRGPDDTGMYINRQIALIHRRLSVIDDENGKQPIYKTKDGNEYIMVYNGELYNTEEIRKDLRELGYKFDGYSDTEVLLLSYLAWGKTCLEHFNGIFAFAIYDKTNEFLFAARDRAGVKPFFYHAYMGGFIFASEIKTLLKNPMVKPNVNRYGIAEVFLIGPGRTPGSTAFTDIEELKPGHCLTFGKDGLQIHQYWEIKPQIHTDRLQDTIEHLHYLLTDTIKRQLVSDVPLCCFLSGGLDSSIISAVAAGEYAKDGKVISTYSISYSENERESKSGLCSFNNDDHYVTLMQKAIGSNHNNVVLENDKVGDALYAATCARDLPGMADADSSLLLFCGQVKKRHTVALSGECADEIFGGYPWYTNPEFWNLADFPWSGNTTLKAMLIRNKFLTFDPQEYVQERYKTSIAKTPKTGEEIDLDRRIKEITYLNLNWFMQTLLDREDRASMYNGLEIRVPFCDHRIIEYTFNIPWEMKCYAGREKGLLRKVFSEELPHEIVYRKKSPYPKNNHPNYVENVKKKVRNILAASSSPIFEIIKETELKNLLETEGALFSKPWYGQMMNFPQILAYIYMIDTWLKEYNVDIID